MKTKHWLLALWVLIVFALHQDVWNWTKAGPLIFGLLPPGLTYHLGYSVLAAITMALLVRFAWPAHLEDEAPGDRQPPTKKP
jgi:hypothetical protein